MKNIRGTNIWGLFCSLWALFTLMLVGATILFLAPFIGAKRAFFGIGKLWVRQQLWLCGGSWSSTGWENLPENIRNGSQPAIFMSNHESYLDPPMLMGAIPVHAVYIARKGVRRMPFVGWIAWAAGTIFIDQDNAKKIALSIARAAERIKQGNSVVIFPEGSRTRDGKVGKFKKGGFTLAAKAGVPIVPLATVGGWEVLPRGAIRPRAANIKVIFGSAVYQEDYPTREALMDEVERQIRALVAALRP